MDDLKRRAAVSLAVVATLILVYGVLYRAGMRAFEGRSMTLLHAIQVVVETFTATGYGSDAPWTSPQMNLFVILMDLTGVALIFLALPVLVFPLLEDLFSTTVPTHADGVSDHVVITTYTSRVDALISELDAHGVDHVIVEPDRETATDLHKSGYRVIEADPDSTDGLRAAGLPDARAIVADVSDQVDASIVLTAQEVADVRIVSVVEEPDREPYHELAGADAVLSPRPLLGRSLAGKVATGLTTDIGESVDIGEDFDLVEVPIHRGSDLVGSTLAGSGLRERTGINVIGAWFGGEFETPPDPDRRIDAGCVLLVTGHEEQLERVTDLTAAPVRRFERGETIVVGHGEVGRTVTEALAEADIPYTVVDREDGPAIDVVGEATDPETLEAAGVASARSIVLALPDDAAAEFATLVVRDRSPDTEIVSRAEETASVPKMYRAGADYVLSLATVTGRLIAAAVIEGEDVISIDTQVEVRRLRAPGLAGHTLAGADVRSRTGCTVVAVDRDGDVHTDLDPGFRVERGDAVVVAGTDAGVERFVELFG